ncbi:MAG: nitroreductase family protein [bacterium]
MDEGRFLELCRARRSVRRFSEGPVEREKLAYCLEAARLAPSADNDQPWRFIVFDDPAAKAALADAAFSGIYRTSRRMAHAPVLVVLAVRENLLINRVGGGVQGTPFQLIDAAIAGEHFVLAAAEQGLGTCWVGWYDARALRRHLGLGRGLRPVCLIAVGYPAAGWKPGPARRRPLGDIADWNAPPRGPARLRATRGQA